MNNLEVKYLPHSNNKYLVSTFGKVFNSEFKEIEPIKKIMIYLSF